MTLTSSQRIHNVREAGFSMLELTVSMPILAILALSMAASVTTSMRSGRATTEQDIAREAARGQMEQILATDFDLVGTNWNGVTFPVGNLTPVSPALEPGLVTVDAGNPDLLVIRVSVIWSGSYGNDTLELTTLLANVSP